MPPRSQSRAQDEPAQTAGDARAPEDPEYKFTPKFTAAVKLHLMSGKRVMCARLRGPPQAPATCVHGAGRRQRTRQDAEALRGPASLQASACPQSAVCRAYSSQACA